MMNQIVVIHDLRRRVVIDNDNNYIHYILFNKLLKIMINYI